MYYPYLRGKQFEFLALRELSEQLSSKQKTVLRPIIEPVKASLNSASIAIKSMKEAGIKFAYILNPNKGDFLLKTDFIYENNLKDLLPSHEDFWEPAFILHGDQDILINNITKCIENNIFNNVLLILPKNEEYEKWSKILELEKVKTVVTCNADSKSTYRRLKKLNKNIVRLDDCFQQEARNRDYIGKENQFFNDNHAFYDGEGMFGFGDYTALPENFIDGGMMPYVVAIHLTYNKSDEEIWIRHFLSESYSNGSENIQVKFKEAAQQIGPFFEIHKKDKTTAVKKFSDYVLQGHYPGLGTLKKLSIEHHITLMCRFLEQKLCL